MTRNLPYAAWLQAACVVVAANLAGCGGGSGSDGTAAPSSTPTPTPTPPPVLPPTPVPPPPPTLVSAPQATSVVAGASVTFSVVANGADRYVWSRSDDNGRTWQAVEGQSSATLLVPQVGLVDNGVQFGVTPFNGSVGLGAVPAAVLTVRPKARLLSGALGGAGYLDAAGVAARFDVPRGLAFDPVGNLYVSDANNHVVRRVAPDGRVTTLAGQAGVAGRVDGGLTVALLSSPAGLAVDAAGVVWLLDQGTCSLRRIERSVVSTVASLAAPRCYLQTGNGVDSDPVELVIGAGGDLLVSDRSRHVIRRVSATGVVTTFAGVDGVAGHADGDRTSALFKRPQGLARDVAGNVYVADGSNAVVRRIAPDGTVSTLVGMPGQNGDLDGVGSAARLTLPRGLALDANNGLLITQMVSGTVRRLDLSSGELLTQAGLADQSGEVDGVGASARFDLPVGVAVDAANQVFVADMGGATVRRIDSARRVTTFAGQVLPVGSSDGAASIARFGSRIPLAADAQGNLYVADTDNHVIRKVGRDGSVTTLAGLAGAAGSSDGQGASARFNAPASVAVDATGNVLVADTGNHTVRKISPTGRVSTMVGAAGQAGDVDGAGTSARLDSPSSLVVDANARIYFVDRKNCKLRSIDSDGQVRTLAGTRRSTCASFGGDGANAEAPSLLALDGSGGLWFVDGTTLRRWRADGSVTLVAGSPLAMAGAQVDGQGTAVRFGEITAIAADEVGRLYVVEGLWGSLRLAQTDGSVRTLIGSRSPQMVRLGESPSLRAPIGLAVLPGNAIAIATEAGIVID